MEKEEKKEGSVVKEHEEEEEKESFEKVVEQVDEGKLLRVKSVLSGFQTIEEEPQEDPSPTKDETILILAPLPPFNLSQTDPQKNSPQMSSLLSFSKPSLKVSYHESRSFREPY